MPANETARPGHDPTPTDADAVDSDAAEPDPRLGRYLRAIRTNTPTGHTGGRTDAHRRNRKGGGGGLTQREVARRAGISKRAYIAFETGERVPAARSLAAIAAALRLSPLQTEHVNRLAAPGACVSGLSPADVDVTDFLASQTMPALAYDATTTVLAYNAHLARRLPILAGGATPANLLTWFFTSSQARDLFVDYDDVARNFIARLRATQSHYADPGPFERLIDDVSQRSDLARRLWAEGIDVSAASARTVYRLRDRAGNLFNLPVLNLEFVGATGPGLRIVICLHNPD